jgi:hypothetical protein
VSTGPGRNLPDPFDFVSRWASPTREGHRLATASVAHADAMLTWSIGLMGGGIFASKDVLASAPVDLRFAAWLPWILGIVFAVTGRLLYDHGMARDRLHHYKRVNMIEMLLGLTDEAIVRKRIDVIFAGGEGLKEGDAAIQRIVRRANGCLYAAHICLGLGVLSVLLVAYLAARWTDTGSGAI